MDTLSAAFAEPPVQYFQVAVAVQLAFMLFLLVQDGALRELFGAETLEFAAARMAVMGLGVLGLLVSLRAIRLGGGQVETGLVNAFLIVTSGLMLMLVLGNYLNCLLTRPYYLHRRLNRRLLIGILGAGGGAVEGYLAGVILIPA